MTNSGSCCGTLSTWLLSVLRIVVGFSFALHGSQKLLNFPHGFGSVPLFSLMGLAGALELVGGGLFLVGLLTRPVAFILCGEMAAAYFIQHARHGLLPLQNGGELAVIYCFVFLYFTAAGAGPLSVDSLLFRRK
jgi:putative oxidoreductase